MPDNAVTAAYHAAELVEHTYAASRIVEPVEHACAVVELVELYEPLLGRSKRTFVDSLRWQRRLLELATPRTLGPATQPRRPRCQQGTDPTSLAVTLVMAPCAPPSAGRRMRELQPA